MAALYKEQLGALIRERRDELDITQRVLADRIGIQEPQTISRWERGENSPTDLEAVARGLETTVGDLLAKLSPAAREDRRRAMTAERTQLDRIEQKLDQLLTHYEGVTPEDPPDDLGRIAQGSPPKSPRSPQAGSVRGKGSRRGNVSG